MNAAILSIGDELTLGQSVDTNSAWLSSRLAERGILPVLHLTVPDDVAAIALALRRGCNEAGLVIVTGGLGPTADDLTREAIAAWLGVKLELHEPSLKQIEGFFTRLGRETPELNRVQAMCPKGARMLENPTGTAPGIFLEHGGSTVFVFPGVPGEMKAMFAMHVEPWLAGWLGTSPRGPGQASSGRGVEDSATATPNRKFILTAKLNTFGTGESVIAGLLGDLMDRKRNPLVGTTVSEGIVAVRIRSEFSTREEAQRELDKTAGEVSQRVRRFLFGKDDETLQDVVGGMLKSRGKTVATAESCTGGLLGKMLTDVSGSSAYYLAGWVVYSNESKQRELGVDAGVIATHGAVSEPVAISLAENVREKAGSDFALAITGVAGPTGGSEEKPVGTVWIGLAERGKPTEAKRFQFPGDRATIRDRAAKTALNMLRLRLT